MNYHFHHVLALQELNVGRPSNKAIKVGLFNPEVHIYPVENIEVEVVHKILSHLDVDISIFATSKKMKG